MSKNRYYADKKGSLFRGMLLGVIFFSLFALSTRIILENFASDLLGADPRKAEWLAKITLLAAGFIAGIFAALIARQKEIRAGVLLGLICTLIVYIGVYLDNPASLFRLRFVELLETMGIIMLGTLLSGLLMKIVLAKPKKINPN